MKSRYVSVPSARGTSTSRFRQLYNLLKRRPPVYVAALAALAVTVLALGWGGAGAPLPSAFAAGGAPVGRAYGQMPGLDPVRAFESPLTPLSQREDGGTWGCLEVDAGPGLAADEGAPVELTATVTGVACGVNAASANQTAGGVSRPRTIDGAIASGLLDPSVATELEKRGSAEAIVVLDSRELREREASLRRSSDGPLDLEALLSVKADIIARQQARVLAAATDVDLVTNYRNTPVQQVRFTSVEGLRSYLRHPEVVGIRENARNQPALAESLVIINQPQVAANGLTGEGTTVVVLDTGVDYTRAAFGSCEAPGEPGCKVLLSVDTGVADDGALDDNGHGTNVAAIVLGVAPDASIIVHDVFVFEKVNSSWQAPVDAQIAAINWAITNRTTYNIVAINMSLGGSSRSFQCSDDPRTPVFADARAAGISVVIASGNQASTTGISSPSCVPGATSVGAVYDSTGGATSWTVCTDPARAPDQIACFSNSAYFLSVLAPGSQIAAGGTNQSGTSQATPHVAGAVAVLREHSPNADVVDLERALLACGPTIADSRLGADGRMTHRLDLLAAVGHLSGSPCPNGPGPANDYIGSATTLNGFPYADTRDTSGATSEPADPILPCGVISPSTPIPHGGTAWYRFTPETDGLLSVSTSGSNYDTLLSVWQRVPGPLTNLGCSDDVEPSIDLTSQLLDLPVVAGTTYFVEVAGFGGAGGDLRFSATFAPATFPATVQWGDGAEDVTEVTLRGGTGVISRSHVYADDGGYTVTVTVSLPDGEPASDTAAVDVTNVAPVVDAVGDLRVAVGEPVDRVLAAFTDQGAMDTHTATIDWGDGSPPDDGRVTESGGSGTIAGTHTYADEGAYTVMVTVFDDDGGSGSDNLVVVVDTEACGDYNGDHTQDILDAVTGLKVTTGAIEPDAVQRVLGDLNRDGVINIFDSIIGLQHLVGLAEIDGCGAPAP